jgi:hypothetical protein
VWNNQIDKVTKTREQYRLHSEAVADENEFIYSADLQKVVMLPRAEMFKEVIFIPHLIAFNESFVPVGKKPKKHPVVQTPPHSIMC